MGEIIDVLAERPRDILLREIGEKDGFLRPADRLLEGAVRRLSPAAILDRFLVGRFVIS